VDTRRLRSIAMIAIFDIGGPLLAYNLLRSNGFSTVAALILSGLFPVVGMIVGFIGHRRVDAVGVLVLAGIVVGAILGLVSRNPKLVLDEGSVSTGVFGLICLGSLATDKPMMYRFALEFMGPDTERGREFADLRQYKEFRRAFVVITVVWGAAYLVEAAARGGHRAGDLGLDRAGGVEGAAVRGGGRADRLDGRVRTAPATPRRADGGRVRRGGSARRGRSGGARAPRVE